MRRLTERSPDLCLTGSLYREASINLFNRRDKICYSHPGKISIIWGGGGRRRVRRRVVEREGERVEGEEGGRATGRSVSYYNQ